MSGLGDNLKVMRMEYIMNNINNSDTYYTPENSTVKYYVPRKVIFDSVGLIQNELVDLTCIQIYIKLFPFSRPSTYNSFYMCGGGLMCEHCIMSVKHRDVLNDYLTHHNPHNIENQATLGAFRML